MSLVPTGELILLNSYTTVFQYVCLILLYTNTQTRCVEFGSQLPCINGSAQHNVSFYTYMHFKWPVCSKESLPS